MISYKQAQQLKDAGFPQENKEGTWVCSPQRKGLFHPYLHDIIEECGKEFYSLIKAKDGTGWWANPFLKGIGGSKTPEGAMVKFYIALKNKKK